jgi:hypothetical protein
MIGKTPSLTHIVARDFRGQRLYLQDFARASSTWRWTNDRNKSQRLSLPAAMQASERASREWGAKCATLDVSGTVAKTSSQAAADNARALLSACVMPNGKVDSKAFLTEMETRAGGKLTDKQYRLLAQIVKAFEMERAQVREAVAS